jgi:hypothetical protein
MNYTNLIGGSTEQATDLGRVGEDTRGSGDGPGSTAGRIVPNQACAAAPPQTPRRIATGVVASFPAKSRRRHLLANVRGT